MNAPHLPKINFDWRISFGNVFSVVAMVGAGFAAWYNINDKVDDAMFESARVPGIESRLTAAETSLALMTQTIEVGRTARLTFQASVVETFKSIEADRREQSDVNSEVLAQLRVIVSQLDDNAKTTRYQGPFTPFYPYVAQQKREEDAVVRAGMNGG